MYLIPITVPIFVDMNTPMIGTDWKRSLVLLRDSLEGRYGPIVVAAPFCDAKESDQRLEQAGLAEDDIELVPLFDRKARLARYWSGLHQSTLAEIRKRLESTKIVHGTAEDPMRPFCYASLMRAAKANLPTVFVQDQDIVKSMRDIANRSTIAKQIKSDIEIIVQAHQSHRAAKVAGLCLFKGKDTISRYGHLNDNILPIEDTSYLSDEVHPETAVRHRLAGLVAGDRSLRFGFAGRLVHIKGLDRSLRILKQARQKGADVALDIIGTGPQEAELKKLTHELGLADHVTFVGPMPYGRDLIARLGMCDALLFNPRMSETPRMYFDAYAAGLPLVTDDIEYARERQMAENAAILMPWKDDHGAIDRIVELDANREVLVSLTQNALTARYYHAADKWYRRRAEATHEMVARHARHMAGNA